MHYIEPPDVFDVLYSVKPIVMVLLGGAGTIFGPIVGAVLFLSLEELVWRDFLQVHTGVLGLLIVMLVLFLPKGLLSLSQRLARRAGDDVSEPLLQPRRRDAPLRRAARPSPTSRCRCRRARSSA